MTDLYIEGPDALKLLSDLGVNSFKGFAVNKGKQFVATNYDGYVIGDAILFFLDKDKFSLVGRPPALNWVQYHAETGEYDLTTERDDRTAANPTGRKVYRYQVQGPNALKVMGKAAGGPVPDIRFFNMDELTIGGCKVRALRHGMVGAPGFELFGPIKEGEQVRAAIVAAGREFGLRQVGARTYPTSTLESGWIPSPLPAIYTGAKMQAYRQWLPANWYEGTASLGGSFYSDDVSDYYLTPFDLGYGPFVKFDHAFVGREALEKFAVKPKRKKVTLAWNGEDVTRAMGTLFQSSDRAKYIDLPLANYSTLPFDKVLKDNRTVGLSTYTGYSSNEGTMLSLACVDVEHSEPGTEVTLVWGEEGGGSPKPTVERHVQTEIRAIVSPAPYAEVARVAYRPQ
jgi:glycine cleavage system aminomethyltransferase T